MPPPRSAHGLTTPSLVIGLGRFGASIARRVSVEAADAHRGQREALAALDGTARWAEAVAEDIRAEGLDIVLAEAPEAPQTLARRVGSRARALLAHPRQSSRRDAPGRDGPARLHVLVLAHLGEPLVRDRLADALDAIEAHLLADLGPIFERYRVGARRGLVLLPLLAMPHPGGHDDGDRIADAILALSEQVAATPAAEKAIPQLFVIEDVAEFSVLGEAELAQCVRNFASLLLHGLAGVDAERILCGTDPQEPLATFACAVAELPRRKLRRYAAGRIALEVLDAIADAPEEPEALETLDAVEQVELATLDEAHHSGGGDAEADVRALIDRYAPPFERDPEPRWYVRGEALRARYGPDHGDASRDAAQPPAGEPRGWSLARMREIEQAWRLLQRRRFDDLIARERRAIEASRDALLRRAAAVVDGTLWEHPAPDAFRRAAQRTHAMARQVAARLEDAVAVRDAIMPPAAPRFDGFREAHAALLDAARRKPDLGRMLLFFTFALVAFVAFGPTILGALADARGLPADGGPWYVPWLRDRAMATSAGVALLAIALPLAHRYARAVRALREAFHDMWAALEATLRGPSGSMLEYYESRLRLAREVARVESLVAIDAALKRDAERLRLIDRAVLRARAELKDEARHLGVRHMGGRADLTSLLRSAGSEGSPETLIESLVGPFAAKRLQEALPTETRDARIADILAAIARRTRGRWRDEIPFSDQEALLSLCAPHAAPLGEWDPLADAELADEAADHIAAFVRRQARTLRVALQYSGYESRDPTGITTLSAGVAIVPAACAARVRSRLEDEGAAGRARIPVTAGPEQDRAYYLVAAADIAASAVTSLAERRPSGDDELRFAIERTEGEPS